MSTTPSDDVAAVLSAAPSAARVRLDRLCALIVDVADEVGASPVTTHLAWGQPSFRSARPEESTAIRLSWSPDGSEGAAPSAIDSASTEIAG